MLNAKSYDSVVRAIIQRLSESKLSRENFLHARNILQWAEFFYKDVDDFMRIAALGHDIECSLQNRVKLSSYSSYSAYRDAVAKESSKIMRNIMSQCEVEGASIEEVCYLIEHINDNNPLDERSYILGNADTMSFLDVGLSSYCKRSEEKQIIDRCAWEYKRLSEKAKEKLQRFYFYDSSVNKYLVGLLEKAKVSLAGS